MAKDGARDNRVPGSNAWHRRRIGIGLASLGVLLVAGYLAIGHFGLG